MLMPFELLRPATLSEATHQLAGLEGRCKVMAGGTDVLVSMHAGSLRPEVVMDIKGVAELQAAPAFSPETGLLLSALCSHDSVERLPEVQRYYTALADACGRVGSVQTRTRGTIGGNICNAVPSGESLGPLLALDARLTLAGPEGRREVAFEDFFLGAKKTVLQSGELLCEIRLPPPLPRFGSAYTKFVRRKAMDLALLGVTVALGLDENGRIGHARVSLTTAAPTPLRAKEAEGFLLGRAPDDETLAEAGRIASAEAKPRSSWRAPADYRHALIETLLPRTAKTALARLAGKEA